MARPLRIEKAGGWYHVTARGNKRKRIYRDDRDRQHFLELIEEMVLRFRVRLHCYVLMDDHYHLLMELTEANLSRAVQWLNVSYSVWFNRRRNRSGRLFQGRFKSVAVDPDEWGLVLSRYLHLNPVRVKALSLSKANRQARRVGLSAAPNAREVRRRMEILRGYRWSSYRAYIGLVEAPRWLECQSVLGLGGGAKAKQRRRYRDDIERSVREGWEASPWESVREQVVLGGAAFLRQLKQKIKGNKQERRGARRRLAERPAFADVVRAIEKVKGRKWAEFRDEYGDTGRDLALYLGRRLCGLKLTALAKEAEIRNYGVVATNVRRYQLRLERDRAERSRVAEILKLLNCEL